MGAIDNILISQGKEQIALMKAMLAELQQTNSLLTALLQGPQPQPPQAPHWGQQR